MMNADAVWKKIKDPLAAFLPAAAVFFLILFRYHIVPFGDTTLLFSDLDTQYIEFLAEYRRILLGKGSFSWSWHAGMGMNITALTAYYLASPFNFLLIIFPENRLPLAVSILTALKLGCAGAAFSAYLRRHDQVQSGFSVIFPVCYALSAYAFCYGFNIMWLDALIWLPLLCLAIDRLFEADRRSMSGMVLVLTFSFLSQFYMAWMTGVFCLLYFSALSCFRKISVRDFFRNMIRFGICVGTAAGLSAFLLLPAFFVLKNNMGLIGQEFPPFTGQFFFPEIITKLFAGSFDGIKGNLPHIYCGIPALFGTVLFFLSGKIKVREKIVSGALLCLLLLSFWFKPLDFLWHAMDHPSWFPYRYAFIFCFWILCLACKGFSEFEAVSDRRKPLSALLTVGMLLLIAGVLYKGSKSRFLLLNAGFLAAYVTAVFIRKRAVQTAFLLLLIFTEIFLNGNMIVSDYFAGYTKAADYQDFHEYYKILTDAAMPAGQDFYRMEKNVYRNYNDALGIGYPGVSHFSSTASTRQAQFLKRLGFNCYATWCTYEGATAATDALLGIRYEFGASGKQDSIQTGKDTWEHPSRFPLFFFADEEFARYDFSAEADAITRQNDLLLLLENGDGEDYFEPVPVQIIRTENLEPDGNGNYHKADSSRPAFLEAAVGPAAEKSLYLFLPGASLSHTVTDENGAELMNGSRDYAPFPICLDAYGSEQEIHFYIEAVRDELSGGLKAYTLDTERLALLSRSVRNKAPQMERTGNTEFHLRTEKTDSDRLVVSSVPFDAGWRIFANGRKISPKMIHDGVLGFVLPASCDEVTVTYRAYGSREGAVLSGCALLLWAALFRYEKRKGRDRSRKAEKF